mgnify:CR=1 FL=1
MHYPEDAEPKDYADKSKNQHLIFDGTANLDYLDDNQIPQVKGLVELLNHYLADKPDRDH